VLGTGAGVRSRAKGDAGAVGRGELVLLSRRCRKESQNHRMLGVERDLCGSSSQTPLPKQGHPEQAVQDFVEAGL